MPDSDSIFDEPESPSVATEKEVKIEVVVTPVVPAEAIKVEIAVEPKVEPATPSALDVKNKTKIIMEKIFKKGHIVDPHIGGMTFRKKLQPKDIGKTKADVPAEIGRAHV